MIKDITGYSKDALVGVFKDPVLVMQEFASGATIDERRMNWFNLADGSPVPVDVWNDGEPNYSGGSEFWPQLVLGGNPPKLNDNNGELIFGHKAVFQCCYVIPAFGTDI